MIFIKSESLGNVFDKNTWISDTSINEYKNVH